MILIEFFLKLNNFFLKTRKKVKNYIKALKIKYFTTILLFKKKILWGKSMINAFTFLIFINSKAQMQSYPEGGEIETRFKRSCLNSKMVFQYFKIHEKLE